MKNNLRTNLKKVANVSVLIFTGILCQAQNIVPYMNPSLSLEQRVEDLMRRMTLEEKVGQMCQYVGPQHIRANQARFKGKQIANNDDAYGFYPNLSVNELYHITETGLVGSFLHVVTLEEANDLQRRALKNRLRIPLLIGIDAIHGNALCAGSTVYPTPIGQAASFHPELVEKISRESALEVRATGAHWTFTPNIDVARDARWGRVGETFGEDPYLVSLMGRATIKGYQGDENTPQDERVAACGKHLIAGSEPVNGTNASPMDVSEWTLREIYLPPYKMAVETGVYTLMAAHNELNGTPCHANAWMMNDIMRKEYGFNGFIVSDWMDIERIYDLHSTTSTMQEAYGKSVKSGVDMHMHGPEFMEGIIDLVRKGKLDQQIIERACRSILEVKFKLGLFEHPFIDEQKAKSIRFNSQHQASALEMAHESIVLLKNEGLLPLDLSKYNNILVTGPNANSHAILGDWTLQQPEENVVTILEGIQQMAGKNKVTFYDYGTDVKQNAPQKVDEAVALSRKADLAIVVVGENPLRYEKTKTCGENIDRMSLDLLGTQEMLIEKIHETGIPVIVVLVGGRPLSVNWISANIPAILQAWEPGSFGGTAVADILCGKVNPSAKLPISIPRHSGQIQMIYNHKPSQYFHKYIDGPSTPLYHFGYGLSYTTFEVSAPILSANHIGKNDTFNVLVQVKNTGKTKGCEVLQLYIRDKHSSMTRPVKELKDFARVCLVPGESRTVSFKITPDKLAFYNHDMKFVVEEGDFEIMVGTSSRNEDLKKAILTVGK